MNASDGVAMIRYAVQVMLQALIDVEAEGVIGAGFWERTEACTAIRDGSRTQNSVDDRWVSGAADRRNGLPGRSSPACRSAGGGSIRLCSRS